MKKGLGIILGLAILLLGGAAFGGGHGRGGRHGGDWHGGYRHGGWGGGHYHRGWGWRPGWGYWHGRAWPYVVDSALQAGVAAYAISRGYEAYGGYWGPACYPAPYCYGPAYSAPLPFYAPPVMYQQLGPTVVTDTVTVVE